MTTFDLVAFVMLFTGALWLQGSSTGVFLYAVGSLVGGLCLMFVAPLALGIGLAVGLALVVPTIICGAYLWHEERERWNDQQTLSRLLYDRALFNGAASIQPTRKDADR